ncbi:tau-cadinol synthase-like isoform X2 [Oryza glaberrima]|uniref:tau-cadinol synthase-like isoform X2 n=1 Tax=Oryza glaberrima TaxID=4538 RepID=UPI00224C5954|nr:tau-cadinol synthase-like isoform X2 [Oryza glaberrima]
MSHYLPFLSHGMVGRRPVLQPVQRCNPTGAQARGFFRQQSASGVLLHAYTHKKSGDAAPSMEASSFQPSVWGDFFINYEPKQLQRSKEWMMNKADKLKQAVRTLFRTCNDMVDKMHLVDAVQRLGIDHLFQEEISSTLSDINGTQFASNSLHEVALRFRLLRENGFWVSPDVFKIFKGEDGRFTDAISNEPRGLLSLYNGAHLLVHDETELVEAISFARDHLQSICDSSELKPPLADQVKRALDLPLPRAYKRMEALHYMFEYGQEEGHIVVLLDLAKLEFNLLQHVHLKELKSFSQWDESAISFLPDYMKTLYNEIMNNFKEFEDQVGVKGRYRVAQTKKEFQKLSTYYLQESEWSHQNHKPSFKEQMELSTMTAGGPLLCVCTTVGRDDTLTKEAFEWAASDTGAIRAYAKILRFMNDVAAFKSRRKNKGDMSSTVECYMNEHNVTSEVAIAKINSLIEDEWKTINQARFERRELLPAVHRVVNLCVCVMFFYDDKKKDAYTFSSNLRETIESLFVNPIPM